MRYSQFFGKTLRDAPSDAETASHRLLLRAGMVQQVAAGIFNYMPLGWRSISKIKNILREEMDRAGALEVNMPVVQPRELWEESGRANTFIPPLASFVDRRERRMVLAPTHEETVTMMAKAGLHSYRDLPFTLYHIQTKFRDEPRPRAGLLRVREFEMKDAYSFDADEAGLDRSFQAMVAAYKRIFSRCGLRVVMVEADSGAIGGKASNEFVLLAESGEDTVLLCDRCGYAANVEKAQFKKPALPPEAPLPMEKFATPGVKTIKALAQFAGVPASKTIKAVFYSVEGRVTIVCIRGDLDVNEIKLRNVLGGAEPRLATPEELQRAGLVAGSASPVGLPGFHVVADDSLRLGNNFIAGANEEGHHLSNVNFPRDFEAEVTADIATAVAGAGCPNCEGALQERRGVEVGHVFKLGTVYSQKLGATFSDENGQEKPALMGCYGIGVGRLLAAAIEANHDEKGMMLPRAIAPFDVYLAGLNLEDPAVRAGADRVHDELGAAGIEVFYDDRDEAPGVKFNDADLIGLPVRVVVSQRSLKGGGIEVKRRVDAGRGELKPLGDAVAAVGAALGRV
jgi:prolyl-tRNA synthetase